MLASLLVGLLLMPTLPAGPRPAHSDAARQVAERESLQDLLRRARRERERVRAELRSQVELVVAQLEALGGPEPASELERLQAEIVRLGGEAAPLFVPYVDPGVGASAAQRFRSLSLAQALRDTSLRSATDSLVLLASGGTPEGRSLAVQLLGFAPRSQRSSACLVDVFREGKGGLRFQAVSALARLGGEENEAILAGALIDEDDQVVLDVLGALAQVKATGAARGVRALCSSPTAASGVLDGIVSYYRACPEVVEKEDVSNLARVAASSTPSREGRIAALRLLADLEPDLDAELRRQLKPVLEDADEDLREEGLICLALLGDRGARREAERKYDVQIERNERYPPAYEQRARLHMRLRQYTDAIRDFKRATELLEQTRRRTDPEVQIDLARAYCLAGKLRQAYDTLEEAAPNTSRLAEIAADPDFLELREHSRYGKIFQP